MNPISDAEERMYAAEKEENFRWISSRFATKSFRTLTSTDLVDSETFAKLAEIGEFAEIAHGSIDPPFVWANRDQLTQPDFPFEAYRVLAQEKDTILKQTFRGTKGDLQGYIAHRPSEDQVVVAFSGTANWKLALRDIAAWRVACRVANEGVDGSDEWGIHSGFQSVYKGVEAPAFAALRAVIGNRMQQSLPTIVLTGHSLGCAVAFLFLLDILYYQQREPDFFLPSGTRFIIACFGPPRVGNDALMKHYRAQVEDYRSKHGPDSLVEYAVIGHADGVPALPPYSLGYRHFFTHPFYLYHGQLYRIPSEEREHGVFDVIPPENISPIHSRGGHNYYNARDMERLQRRMKGIAQDITDMTTSSGDWMQKYLQREKEEKERWLTTVPGSGPLGKLLQVCDWLFNWIQQ